MKVYILFKDKYEGREIEGVYTSLEAAQAKFPDAEWEQRQWHDYEDYPPLWEDKGKRSGQSDRRVAWGSDIHIEEHEVNGWAASGNVETYDDWKVRLHRSRREAIAKVYGAS